MLATFLHPVWPTGSRPVGRQRGGHPCLHSPRSVSLPLRAIHAPHSESQTNRITIRYISEELNIPMEDVESLLVTLILDNRVQGYIDQMNQVLNLKDIVKQDARYNAINKWYPASCSFHNSGSTSALAIVCSSCCCATQPNQLELLKDCKLIREMCYEQYEGGFLLLRLHDSGSHQLNPRPGSPSVNRRRLPHNRRRVCVALAFLGSRVANEDLDLVRLSQVSVRRSGC